MSAIVYALSNEAMPGILKIGRTDRDNPGERMRELYSTGVPLPFECVKAVEVQDGEEASRLEAALHQAFGPDRVNSNREFFRISEAQIKPILDAWPGGTDATDRASEEVSAGTDTEDRKATDRARRRRPNLDLVAVGVKDGDDLIFSKNSLVKCEVTDAARKFVRFNGEEMSLRKATNTALGKPDLSSPVRPASYWLWEGELLEVWYEAVME